MRTNESLTRKLTVVAALAALLAVSHWAIGPTDAVPMPGARSALALPGDLLADRTAPPGAATRANDASDPISQPANDRHDNDQHQQWDDLPPIGQAGGHGSMLYADARTGG